MKKKVVCMILAASMMTSMLAGTPVFAEEEDNVIKIGVICSMTGGNAVYGEGAQNAIDLAVEEINSSDSEYKVEVVKRAYDIDLSNLYDGEAMIGNKWKHESVIDFDNPVTPISNGEDVAQSLYNALVAAWEEVA